MALSVGATNGSIKNADVAMVYVLVINTPKWLFISFGTKPDFGTLRQYPNVEGGGKKEGLKEV